ncbi:MAG: hypothetical protein JO208_10365 [Alphaproteobacteria bacterium]|nr:hypothetical protein [Alphaproteobacteria bacterium]
MGWRGQANRDEDERAWRRSLPLSRRYDWGRVATLLLVLALGIVAFVLGRSLRP